MKLTIQDIDAWAFSKDLMTFPHSQDGETHSIELTPDAQRKLALALLASAPVPDGTKPRLALRPTGIQTQKTGEGQVRLAFQLGSTAAVHFLLTAEECRQVREQLVAAEQSTALPK